MTSSQRSLDASTTLSAGGALLAAILSSACCWLPLLLIGVGASSLSFGSMFSSLRWPLLGLAGLLLGLSFWRVARRRPNNSRTNLAMLWTSVVLVAGFAVTPEVIGAFAVTPGLTSTHSTRTAYAVEGMTCGGCAIHITSELETLPLVTAAHVSFENGLATVDWVGEPNHELVVVRLASLGYDGYWVPNLPE